MPIPLEDLEKNFVVALPDETIGALLVRLPADHNERANTYVVQPVGDGRYVVVRWLEVEQIATAMKQDIRGMQLSSLAGLPQPIGAVEQSSMGGEAARRKRDTQPGRRLVVLADGKVIGLLVLRTHGSENLPPDPFSARRDTPSGGVLGVDDEELSAPPPSRGLEQLVEPIRPAPLPAGPAAQPEVDNRVINAWIDSLAKDEPLELGQTYDLKFNVDLPRADARATAGGIGALMQTTPPDQEKIEIQVVLDTDDFTVYGAADGTLVVPRVGKSKNTVTFSVEPKKNGPCTIKALFMVNNRVFQRMTITLQVGAVAANATAQSTTSSGLTLGSALARTPSQQHMLNLMIIKKDAGYQFIVQNGGMFRAFLNLSEAQIADLITRAREVLKQIVYTTVNGQYAYQGEDTNIPAAVHAASLKELAKLGYFLYQKVFYAPGNAADAQRMGSLLRELSQKEQLHIGIIPERFVFPWALLYDRDPLDLNNVDPEGFWGFKHIVEYLPEFSSPTTINFNPEIVVSDKLGIGFVFNTTIDTQLSRPIVKTQRDFLQALPGVTVSEHPNVQDLYDLLNNADAPTQLLYFYCHAVSNIPGEKGGVDSSRVILSDGPVPLDELNIYAPTNRPPLKQAPLVFLNACQSAELSPYLYDGLVPYLITRGARGVLGTEVDTPALFAAEFAQEFLKRFVAGGQTLGELLLDMRRSYLTQKNNVMGLLYALYSSGEVVVQRG